MYSLWNNKLQILNMHVNILSSFIMIRRSDRNSNYLNLDINVIVSGELDTQQFFITDYSLITIKLIEQIKMS